MSRKGKPLDYYLSLRYPVTLSCSEEDGVWFATYPDLPGTMAHGKTQLSALKAGEEVKNDSIKYLFDNNLPIPVPASEADYSGRFLLRIGPALHKALATEAEAEGMSLNGYVKQILRDREVKAAE